MGRKFDTTSHGGATAADTNSKMADTPRWEAILPPDELTTVPLRTSDEYLGFCEKIITELTQKLEDSEEETKVREAEPKIGDLMSQLKLNESIRERKCSRRESRENDTGFLPDSGPDPSCHGFTGSFRTVVEPTDSKDYLCKLRAESHLTPKKSYESMNYRDLVLGMAGVHFHLLMNGYPVDGYEAHCLFVKRKSASFLYTNQASILYDRFVTDKVIAGEFKDFPSSCSSSTLDIMLIKSM